MIRALWTNRRAIEWDMLVIWILVLIALVAIFIIIMLSRGKMDELVDKLANIFRFGT